MSDANPSGGRRRRGRRPPPTPEARIHRALRELGRAAAEMAEARGATLPDGLQLDAPLTPTDEPGWRARATAFAEALAVALVARPAAWKDGAMHCFQCASVDCAHATPPDARYTFAGYVATGKPTWIEFLELCLQRRPPDFDRLFADPPGVVAFAEGADDLTEGLLPGFGRGEAGYTVLGQVAVGLLPARLGAGEGRAVLTVQVVETRAPGPQPEGERLRLNLLGVTRDDIVRAASDGAPRNPAEQLRRTLHRTRAKLEAAERRLRTEEARGRPTDSAALVGPIVSRLRGDVSRIFSPDPRRTRHAETRHRGAARPTSTAWDDARAASDDRLMADTRRGTIIALGPRGRAHVFTREGRHVTSLRLEEGELARKIARQRWAPLDGPALAAFRAALLAAGAPDGEGEDR